MTPHIPPAVSDPNEPLVVLVDVNDREIGVARKQEAHVLGQLHRAISVFLFDPNGSMLLQRRAVHKYHSGGLWTNTCCSHPAPGESPHAAALRRLQEEMGIVCPLEFRFSFVYRTEFENGLTEHEFDHVFFGTGHFEARPDPNEVAESRWVTPSELDRWMEQRPEDFTFWFKHIYDRVRSHMNEQQP
jgi:isopentenyl-diphosphate delta-isomerase